jgi:hypothetical protein
VLVDQFGLQRVEETLGHGVVEAVPRSAGAEDQSGTLSELLDPQRQKWAAAIGVEEEPGAGAPSPRGCQRSIDGA